MRTLLTLLGVLLTGYVALVVLFYALQDRLLYFPSRPLIATPAQLGLPFDAVTFETADGERLHGWWIPAAPQRGVLLFCHGNAGNISGRLASIEQFHRLGLSVFIFDYRGYGASTGRPSERGLYQDAAAAWRHLTEARGINPSRIVVFGRSLGAGVATWLAAHQAPGALILESAFTSVPDVAHHHYPFLPARWLARARFNSLKQITNVRAPVLIIHSPRDEIIPFPHGQRLFEAAREPKTFLPIDGGHNDGFFVTGRPYLEGLDAFLKAHLWSQIRLRDVLRPSAEPVLSPVEGPRVGMDV